MDVPHQPAGVFVHRIAAGGGGQHRQEVALLLRGDAPLVGQLVGDGGGDQAGGGVHVDVGLPGESKVDAGEVHGAHDPGEEHPLGRSVLKFQEGEQVLRALVDVRAPGKDLVQRRIERPRLIPGHLVGCLRQIFREPRGHRRQIRERYLLRPDAGPVLEGVRVIAHPPQQAGSGADAQPGADRPQNRAVSPALPPPSGPDYRRDVPYHIGQREDGRQDIQHLHHREGDPIAQAAQRSPDRGGYKSLQGVHPVPVLPGDPEGRQQDQVRQQPDVQFLVGLEKCHAHSAAASSWRV